MKSIIKTNGLIEQHIHGAFGVDFSNCGSDEIIDLSKVLPSQGITMFFPTLVTDSIDNLQKQIKTIKKAQSKQPKDSAKIIGIHLEGPFINQEKSGIHNKNHILLPNLKDFKKIDDEIIKIVTLAPELDKNYELCSYLKSRNIKVSAGHTLASEIDFVNQVTHLFNAMGGIDHKKASTATVALTNDEISTEVIADSIHINDEVLKLIFKTKPADKIILISDALPITHSKHSEMEFWGEKIYLKNNKATNLNGTLAGSAMLLNDIITNIVSKNLLPFDKAIQMATTNLQKYHQLENNANIYWDENLNIIKYEFI